MNINISKKSLKNLKLKLKEKFPQLTEADLLSPNGDTNDMMRMVEYKLGKTKEEMVEILENL